MAANYYDILGVSRTASAAEVRSAYAKLARERHPDRFTDPVEKAKAEEFFKDLTTGFNTLSSEKSRREYDGSLDRPAAAPPQAIAQNAYERGVQMFEAKHYHEAVELLRTAVGLFPDQPDFQVALGKALAKNPHWVREGMQAMERAVQLAPRVASHQTELAELLLAQGLKLRARKLAEGALRLDRSNERALRVLEEAGPSDPEPPAAGGLRGLLKRKS